MECWKVKIRDQSFTQFTLCFFRNLYLRSARNNSNCENNVLSFNVKRYICTFVQLVVVKNRYCHKYIDVFFCKNGRRKLIGKFCMIEKILIRFLVFLSILPAIDITHTKSVLKILKKTKQATFQFEGYTAKNICLNYSTIFQIQFSLPLKR